MRLKQLFKVAPAIAVVVMAVFVMGLCASAAWAGNTAIATYRTSTMLHNMEIDLSWQEVDGAEMDASYPSFEVVAIDGVPWQETPFAENIKKDFGKYFDQSRFEMQPELREIVLDKRFNGRGFEAWELLGQGKSASEVKKILLSKPAKTPPSYGFNAVAISKKELDKILEARYGVPVDMFAMRITETNPPKQSEPEKKQNEPEKKKEGEAPEEVTVALYLNQTSYSVATDGTWRQAKMGVAPINENGRTLVPLRGVLEQFDATIDWVPETKQIIATLGDRDVTLSLGSAKATVNGNETQLDALPKVIDGHTLIPLRFVSEQLGLDVKWDGDSQSITIK